MEKRLRASKPTLHLRSSGIVGLTLIMLLLSGVRLHAQDRPFPYSLGKQDMILLPAGLGLAALGESLRKGTGTIALQDVAGLGRADVFGFDRAATGNWSPAWAGRSDQYRDLAMGTAVLFMGVEGARSLLKGRASNGVTLGVMLVEVASLTLGTSYMTKALVNRKRPYVFNSGLSVDERFGIASEAGNEVFFSFFSGHAAAAFAAATFTSTLFTDFYGKSAWSRLVWGSTLTAATLTGYSRVKAGVHYPSDVIAGALVGSALGYLVPRIHRTKGDGRVSLSAAPGSLGLAIRF